MHKKFTEHPRLINETYWQHFYYAVVVGMKLSFISFVIIIHAVFPFLFEDFASSKIRKIHKKMTNRLNTKNEGNLGS